jgi:hypothetical protein
MATLGSLYQHPRTSDVSSPWSYRLEMTWRADEIMIPASSLALQTVREDALLAPFAYVLKNPAGERNLQHIDPLPPEGLLVLRPVCDASDDAAVDWYHEPLLDWASFPGPADHPFEADRARVAEATDSAIEALPPTNMLSYLWRIAQRTQVSLLVYSCFMWGGNVESEQAWIVGASNLAIVNRVQGDSPNQVVIVQRAAPVRIAEGDVLSLALEHLGIVLPTPHFLPHTRTFPWQDYRFTAT